MVWYTIRDMNKPTIVNTPVGKIVVEPNATPSRSASATIAEMKNDFLKVANSGSVSNERLKDNDSYGYGCE